MKIYFIGIFNPKEPQLWFRKMLASFGEYIEDDWFSQTEIYGKAGFNKRVLQRCQQFQPDVVFCQLQNGDVLTEQTLRSINAFTINWTGDVRHPIPDWYIKSGAHFGLTLFTNVTDVKTIRRHGITADYYQTGIGADIYSPTGPKNTKHNIVFMGNHYSSVFPLSGLRHRICHKLKEVYGEAFGIYGHNWAPLEHESSMYKHLECAAIYRGCKIAVNLSHYDYERYSSDRLFRIMFTGAFCLSHHYKDIEKDFTPGVHLDTWKTIEELIDKCEYYLHNDRARKKIAKAGLEHVRMRHSAKVRKVELLKLIKTYSR